jgi:hypothetical protein
MAGEHAHTRADDVLELHAAVLHVDRRLAADERVHARHQSGGHLHKRAAPHVPARAYRLRNGEWTRSWAA